MHTCSAPARCLPLCRRRHCRRRQPLFTLSRPTSLLLQGVCPGDVLMGLPETGVVRIGGGVQQAGEALVAVKAGVLRQARNGKLWVEARQRR